MSVGTLDLAILVVYLLGVVALELGGKGTTPHAGRVGLRDPQDAVDPEIASLTARAPRIRRMSPGMRFSAWDVPITTVS